MSAWPEINKDIQAISTFLETPIATSESIKLKNTNINNNNNDNNNKVFKPKGKLSITKLPVSKLLGISQHVSKIIHNIETKLNKEGYEGPTKLGPTELINDLIPNYNALINPTDIPKSSESNKLSEISNTTGMADTTTESIRTTNTNMTNVTNSTNSTNNTNTTNGNTNGVRNRGRGRPQGSNSRNANANNTNTAMHRGGIETDRSISNHNSTLVHEVKREIMDSPPVSTGANTSIATNTSNTSNESGDKLMTIGAKYGYPSPPPLSTYNGKIGRSFYTSIYNPSTPILPNSQVAYSSGGFNNSQSEWILCRVLKILSETRFEIQDPEPDELYPNGQIFRANYKEIILIPLHLLSNNLSRLKEYKSGTRVLAKYPETTTFYPAEVVNNQNGVCMLRFEGEEEVNKLTPVDRVFVLPMPK